jgi:hypothetical protein
MTTDARAAVGRSGRSGRFALFADCLLLGLLTAGTMVGVVTAYPGFVAACAVLRDRVAQDRSIGPGAYVARLRQIARTGPPVFFVVPPLVAAVLGADALAVAAGVPGRTGLLVVLSACAAAIAVIGLRLAAMWRPDRRWPELTSAAVRAAAADPAGSALLLIATGVAVVIAITVPVTAPLLLGPLALAAAAVDLRGGRRLSQEFGHPNGPSRRRRLVGRHPGEH